MWAEQATVILMSTKIQTIMSNSVNPILLGPALGMSLTINSVLLKMAQLISWLLSGHHSVSPSPRGAVTVSVKQLWSVHPTLKGAVIPLSGPLTA